MRTKVEEKKSEGINMMENTKNSKKIIIPLVLLFTLIMAILLIGMINNGKIGISKNFSNTIMADTVTTQDIGTDIIANFDSDTGELSISTSSTDILYEINKDSFRDFIINTCGINNIRTITFINEVYAPEDSSELFKGLSALTNINNLNNLNISNVINMSSMFENTGLTLIDLSNWDTSNITNINYIFNNCASLTDIYTPNLYSTETVTLPTDKWYNMSNTDDNNIYSNYNQTTFTTGSVHLKKLIDYNITYELDTEIENPTTYNALSSFTLNNPTKIGYTFIGWTGANGEEAQETVSITPRTLTGDLTYTANWERIIETYTITYNLNGGEETTNPRSYTKESEDIVLAEPTKAGYTFIGWTGTEIEEATKEVTIVSGSTGNREYTANWEAIGYTITYNLNGGEETTNPRSYTKESEDIVLAEPTKAGYTFIGWTGTGIEGDEPIEKVTIGKGSTGDREYIANWEAIGYTITYNLNGGEATNPTEYTIDTKDFIINPPTKEGYEFLGWSGTGISEEEDLPLYIEIYWGSSGDREYTANWEAIGYTITYNLNGGEETTNPISYTKESEDIVLAEPTKAGYTFIGWTGTEIEEATKEVTITSGSTGNREYTANWEAIGYTITYNLDGGEETTNPTSYTIEDEDIVLNAPTKEGYTFIGWTGTGIDTETKEVTITSGSTGNREYTANWERIIETYTITYNLNGGEETTNPISYTKESEDIVLAEPTKAGYTFIGWTGTGIDTETKEVTITSGSTGNREYTANWEAIGYTITYNLNGGEETTNPISYTKESEDIVLAEPTKAGYTFIGWTGTGIDTETKEVTITSGSTGNREYTANWEATEYTITYNLNGGEETTNPRSYTKESEGIVLAEPTKAGYTFIGWTGTEIEEATKEVTITSGSTGNREYTANWEAIGYTITYNLNGGEETTNPISYTKESEDIVLAEPTKAGYTFIGWTGTEIEEATKEVTIANGSTGNREYTANWEAIGYTITYNLNGGEETTNPRSYTKESEDIVLAEPTKAGYTFIGWTGTEIEEATKEVTIVSGSTGNREYTANWEAIGYTITYNLNGGEETTNPRSYTKESEDIVLAEPTKAGYTFIGWTGTEIEEATKEVTITSGSTGNREYTANWEAIGYTITYNLNGGEETTNPISYTKESEDIVLAEPTKAGYTFIGWTGTEIEEATKEVTIANGSTGNREYTANWEAIGYTITYNLNGGEETTNPRSYTKESEDIVLAEPTKAGYTFIGWTGTEIEEATKEVTIANGSTGNREYTANWEAIGYTITYNLNGGEETTNPRSYTKESEDIVLAEPTKAGYTFIGWTGTEIEEATKEVTIVSGSTGNREYTANWEAIGYTITYNLNGGEETTNPRSYTKESEDIVLAEPTKAGYTFIGWTGTEIEEATKEVTIVSGSTGNREYTANWGAIGYTITYNLNGGEETTNPRSYTKESEDIVLAEPTKAGYTFIGWTGTEIEEATKEVTIANGSTGNREYTANWEAIGYTITYNLNGGEETTNPRSYTKESEDIVLAEPTKAGYTFIGWTGTGIDVETKEVTITSGSTGNREYTANWQIRTDLSYTVNYLEKGTNKVISEAKIEENQTFGNIITSTDEIIQISGYKYDSVDKETLEITTEDNILNIYYIVNQSQVVVHHYIYDKEAETEDNRYTTIKLVEDEIEQGIEGQAYTTNKSNKVPLNYTCINETPVGHTGIMTNNQIEVNYYYSLTTPTIENNIILNTTVPTNTQSEELVLTKEDGKVNYNIKYTSKINNYIGKATIEIVDTLPAKIDIDKSELAGGNYNEQNHTITWIEEINNINTFINGNYTKDITKQIEIVYKEQDVTQDLVNTVTGNTTTYYPETYLNKTGEVIAEKNAIESEEIKQDYKSNFKVIKVWEDNENSKNKRPESVTVEIRIMPNDRILTKELNEENNWTYEENGLAKYNKAGEKITYQITEKETNEGDLEEYEQAEIEQKETQDENATNYITIITNSYKQMDLDLNTEITIDGKKEIQAKEDIDYTINIKSEIEDYIGEGKVTIEKRLPYEIDLEKSDIGDGIYNKEEKLISWEIELEDINAGKMISLLSEEPEHDEPEAFVLDITKQIKLTYRDLDLEQEKIETEVKAKIELYETREKYEKVQTFTTNVNVPGKVIVKYIDKASGNEIAETEEIVDKIGKEYKTEKKEIKGYKYIESTNNETGKIKEEEQEVIYYYEIAKAQITVKYQDKEGNSLLEDILIEGTVGENYKTEQKEIENYKYVEVKGNPEGTITEDETVMYIYEKTQNTILNVRYIDIDTEQDISYKEGEEDKTYSYQIPGNIGDDYETEEKEIPYYILVKSTENQKGKLTELENTVIYSYRKLDFNFSVEETIEAININGKNIEITDDKLAKVEIKSEEIKNTELTVKYNIKVTNEGELAGIAKILETIPEGYEIVQTPEYWKKYTEGKISSEVQLGAGESKDLKLTVKWVNKENNLGSKSSTVQIIETLNTAYYEDTDMEDDKSEAVVVVNIKTGEVVSIMVIMMIIVSLGICGYISITIINKKGPSINKIKFLNK